MSDRYAGMGPKTKRFVKASVILPTPVIVGGILLSNYLGFWPVLLIVMTIAAAVFVPLGFAARREGREIAEPESEQGGMGPKL